MNRQDKLRALRNALIEAAVYALLVTIYALSVLVWLAEPLAELYRDHRGWYAAVSLALIVAQGVVLEEVTSFLLSRLRLSRFD